jgi:hypothetical protein
MIITKKHLSRRTVLRGLGATIALPLLDGMSPAFASSRFAAAQPRRFVAVYAGNGMTMPQWTPASVGALELSPILTPLEPFKDHMIVASGLDSKPVDLVQDGAIHPRCQTAWLTGALAKKTDYNVEAGISLDQVVAREYGQDTQLTSLELAMESPEGLTGNCAFGYSCAYNNTIAWSTPTTPLPMENNPRRVFERLFGGSGSTDPEIRRAYLKKNRSILDSVVAKVTDLKGRLSAEDTGKLTQYLDAVRDVERRIQLAEDQADRELPVVDQPVGIPGDFQEHAKLQFDLMALAFQTDLTRVGTFLLAREFSNRAYPEIGVNDSHHPLSHHGNAPDKMERLARLNTFHLSQHAYFLSKLAETPDGDGTLLDHTMTLYGAGIGNSNMHDPHNVPVVVAGGGIKQVGGRHIKYPDGSRLSNFYLTMLDRLNVDLEKFGDSTGALEILSV